MLRNTVKDYILESCRLIPWISFVWRYVHRCRYGCIAWICL